MKINIKKETTFTIEGLTEYDLTGLRLLLDKYADDYNLVRLDESLKEIVLEDTEGEYYLKDDAKKKTEEKITFGPLTSDELKQYHLKCKCNCHKEYSAGDHIIYCGTCKSYHQATVLKKKTEQAEQEVSITKQICWACNRPLDLATNYQNSFMPHLHEMDCQCTVCRPQPF